MRKFCYCKSYRLSLRKKCPYSELFWSAFFRIQTEYGEMFSSNAGKCGPVSSNTDTFCAVCYAVMAIKLKEHLQIHLCISYYLQPSLIGSDANVFADKAKNMCVDWSNSFGDLLGQEPLKSF